MVTSFLNKESNVGMGEIIDLIYHHPQSRLPNDSPEAKLYFSPPDVAAPTKIAYARPSMSTWALQLVGPEMRRQIGTLTVNDPDDPDDITQLRASTNRCARYIHLATWDHLGRVSIPWMARNYRRRASGAWYITECMGAPTYNGAIVICQRCLHPTVQVGVISSLTLLSMQSSCG
ncbi:hypothetical protein B0H17DRAFT_1265188 [Mycena rosella]|uniref:Uncharacterized protein n=1 Tax=Mycena rosella TaxID=1033263 RepID=A0AAD7CPC0_MYCRO|nr:hypothetical protein B0H17DRAFT_1265188 [Mycena rosella]